MDFFSQMGKFPPPHPRFWTYNLPGTILVPYSFVYLFAYISLRTLLLHTLCGPTQRHYTWSRRWLWIETNIFGTELELVEWKIQPRRYRQPCCVSAVSSALSMTLLTLLLLYASHPPHYPIAIGVFSLVPALVSTPHQDMV